MRTGDGQAKVIEELFRLFGCRTWETGSFYADVPHLSYFFMAQ
jgi:hypothetical protein